MTDNSASLIELEQTSQLLGDDMISIVNCPEKLNASFVLSLSNDFEELIKRQPFVLLELEKTSFIDSRGIEWLIRLAKLTSNMGGGLYLKEIKPSLIRFLKLNRVWDLFEKNIINNRCDLKNIIKTKKTNHTFYTTIKTENLCTCIHLFGRLDANQMNRNDLSCILKHIQKHNCILDLTNLTFIDSTGLTLFIKILKISSISKKQCLLCGLNDDVKQMFTITKLINLFSIVADLPSALMEIRKTK